MTTTEDGATPRQGSVLALRRRAAAATLLRLDSVLDAFLWELPAEVPEYRSLDPKVQTDLRPTTRAAMVMVLRAIAGEPPEQATLALLEDKTSAHAAARFPLHAVIQGYHALMKACWRVLVDELAGVTNDSRAGARALAEMSLVLMRLRSSLTHVAASAYLEHARQIATTTESLRRDVFDQLLSGEATYPEALRERVRRGGYRLGEHHVVAVLTIDGLQTLSPGLRRAGDDALHALPEALRTLRPGGLTPFVEHRRTGSAAFVEDRVVAIFPLEQEERESLVREAIESALGPVNLPDGCHLLVGLGRAEDGLAGIHTSHQQALRTLDGVHATGTHSGVVTYAEMLPTLLLLQDRTLAQDSWMATVQPLFAHDSEHGTQLVATLSAFLEERGVLAATAKRLFIHRHTLAPRLERIEGLTGRLLRDRNDVLMLELGLRARLFSSDDAGDRRSPHAREDPLQQLGGEQHRLPRLADKEDPLHRLAEEVEAAIFEGKDDRDI